MKVINVLLTLLFALCFFSSCEPETSSDTSQNNNNQTDVLNNNNSDSEVQTNSETTTDPVSDETPDIPDNAVEETEPNDEKTFATPISIPYDGYGRISYGDDDFYKFTIDELSAVFIKTYACSGEKTDTELWLYNSTREIGFNRDGPTAYAELHSGPLDPGTYYFKIGVFNDLTHEGDYCLRVEPDFCIPGVPRCNGSHAQFCNSEGTDYFDRACLYQNCLDIGGGHEFCELTPEEEPNNTDADANTIPVPYDGYGFVDGGDKDWYKFELDTEMNLVFTTWDFKGFGADVEDTVLYVLDQDCERNDDCGGRLACFDFHCGFENNDIGGGDNYSQITRILEPGVHYVMVKSSYDTTTGYYGLHIKMP